MTTYRGIFVHGSICACMEGIFAHFYLSASVWCLGLYRILRIRNLEAYEAARRWHAWPGSGK